MKDEYCESVVKYLEEKLYGAPIALQHIIFEALHRIKNEGHDFEEVLDWYFKVKDAYNDKRENYYKNIEAMYNQESKDIQRFVEFANEKAITRSYEEHDSEFIKIMGQDIEQDVHDTAPKGEYKLDEWSQMYAEKITKNPTYQNYLRKAYIDGFWRCNSIK